jgi:MSHA biogenesis protein MshQ
VGNTGVDHYEIYHDGVGITCLAEPITIKACANADCSAVVATPLSVDLSIGSVSETLTLSTGQIAYDFNFSNTGTYPVTISNQSLAAPVSCYVNNQLSANCNIMFTDSLLSITVPTLTACKAAQATIQAIATDPNNQSCKAAISGNRTINFWSDYVNPTTGSRAVEIEGTAISTASPGTPINLHFSSDGQATFDVNYADAGQLSLSATFQAANGKSLSGTSDPFISKPVGLAVYTEEANAECITEDASCSAFKRAGETFDLKVNAACWTDDADTDFTDNPVTPNFELSNITATHALLAPVSGQLGSLSTVNVDFLLTDNGTHTLTQSVSEVGVFEFGISAPSYFGETLSTYASPAIGRFYPDHFKLTTLNEGDFSSACSGFTYSGQDVTYQTKPQLTITAYSTNPPDSITQNYTGDFAKLTATDVTVTPPTTDANQLGADNTNLVNLTWTPDSPTLIDHADGTLTFSFGDDSYRYLHELNSQIDQFTNAVNLTFTSLTDSDGVSAQALPYTLTPGGEVIRFGRLTIANAHGSELLPLSLTLTAEYFNGINWVDNAVDQCSVLNLATDIQLRNTQTAAGAWQTGTTVMTIGSGSTQASLTNNAPLSSGQATLTFSAPGEDNDGYVDIQSQLGSTAPWLLGDYDGDGVFDDEATGRASFGLFKGSDNIIFRREIF